MLKWKDKVSIKKITRSLEYWDWKIREKMSELWGKSKCGVKTNPNSDIEVSKDLRIKIDPDSRFWKRVETLSFFNLNFEGKKFWGKMDDCKINYRNLETLFFNTFDVLTIDYYSEFVRVLVECRTQRENNCVLSCLTNLSHICSCLLDVDESN